MELRPRPGTAPSDAIEVAWNLWRRGRVVVRRTPGLLVLSLMIGAALWVFVTDVQNPRRVDLFPAGIRVEAVNVGQALAVANTLSMVQLRVSAPEDRWEHLTSANFRAFVDLNGLESREQDVAVTVQVKGIAGVRIVETVPSAVVVNLEDFVRKSVPVLARMVGTVPVGYEVDSPMLERETVEVSGPESLVDLVREAVAEVNVTGITLTLQQMVELTPRGAGAGEIRGVRLDPPSLKIALVVSHKILRRTMPLVPVVEGQPANGYRVSAVTVEPTTVTAQGTIESLHGLDALILDAVTVEGLRDGRMARVVALRLPEGVRTPSQQSATVVVTVEPVKGLLRLVLAPEAYRHSEDLVASFQEDTVVVVLSGPLPTLNVLSTGDVRALVDASGLDETTQDLTVDVVTPPGVTVVTVQPSTLSVTLARLDSSDYRGRPE